MRSRTRPHFLVAEDTPSQQTLMAAFIESIGGSALIVNNGDAALRWATVERYAGLIIDLNMPKVTGDAVLRRMRETPGPNQSTPAMLWTAATLPPARRTALEEISSLTIKIKPLGLRDFRRWVNASVLPADEQLNGQSNSSV